MLQPLCHTNEILNNVQNGNKYIQILSTSSSSIVTIYVYIINIVIVDIIIIYYDDEKGDVLRTSSTATTTTKTLSIKTKCHRRCVQYTIIGVRTNIVIIMYTFRFPNNCDLYRYRRTKRRLRLFIYQLSSSSTLCGRGVLGRKLCTI